MRSDVGNDVNTKNDVNRSGCVVVDVWNDVDFEKDVSCRNGVLVDMCSGCLLYTSPSPRDKPRSRMPSSA